MLIEKGDKANVKNFDFYQKALKRKRDMRGTNLDPTRTLCDWYLRAETMQKSDRENLEGLILGHIVEFKEQEGPAPQY